MKKLIFTLVFAFSFIFVSSINAQSYSSAVGAKLGYGLNATYKKELKESMYVDIYAGIRTYYFVGGAALELHKPIESIDNLYWYYGGGAYLGFYSYNVLGLDESYTFIGINGVLGLDYTFDEIPLNISTDWMPGFNLTGSSGFYAFNGGLSVRYILGEN